MFRYPKKQAFKIVVFNVMSKNLSFFQILLTWRVVSPYKSSVLDRYVSKHMICMFNLFRNSKDIFKATNTYLEESHFSTSSCHTSVSNTNELSSWKQWTAVLCQLIIMFVESVQIDLTNLRAIFSVTNWFFSDSIFP